MHETKDINKNTGELNWSLRVHCPQCGECNDLASGDHDPENHLAAAIFNNQWEKAQGLEVTCEHCQHEFELGKIEY